VLELGLDHDFEPGLPLELYMHSEAHRLKPHLKSLIHVHSPNLVALAALAEVPSDLLMMHASFWPRSMPVWEEPDLVRERADARKLIGILGEQAIALLRWHGAVIVGRTLAGGADARDPRRGARRAAHHGASRTAGRSPRCRGPLTGTSSTRGCSPPAPTTCTSATPARS